MARPRNISEFTGIRFFAALHVVFYHGFQTLGGSQEDLPFFLRHIFSMGGHAVSFFFVLSGFILTYVYIDKNGSAKVSYKIFAWARFSRLYPVYLFSLLIDLPRGVSYFFSNEEFISALFKITVSIGAYLLMIQSWHPSVTVTWNSPAWSLSTEAFFYISFLFLVPILWKAKHYVKTLSLLFVLPHFIFLLLNQGFSYNLSSGPGEMLWRAFPPFRVFEFATGIVLGKIFILSSPLKIWAEKNRHLTSFLFWLALFTSLAIISGPLNYPRNLIGLTFLLPCFSIMIFTLATTRVAFTSWLNWRPIQILGNASFALYITHQPVRSYVDFSMEKLEQPNGYIYFITYIFITLAVSVAAYYLIEAPFQKRLLDWGKKYGLVRT